MRRANALLVAGIVIVVAGLSGASFAADESGRAEPADVVGTEGVGGADAAAPDESEAPEPTAGDGGERPADAVPTEEVEPTFDGGRGEEGGEGPDDAGHDRAEKEKDKVPLADVSVDMVNIQFKPKTVSIEPGDEVSWTNKDTAQHNAVGEGAADFDTGLLKKGETASVPFNESGTFDYLCTVHPTMKGTVKVGSGGGTGGGDKGGTSSTGGITDTSTGTGGTGSTFPSSGGSGSDFSGGGGSSSGGGSLPQTGQAELPLLLLGTGLIVLGLLGRAFHEYWIWR